MTEKDDSKFAEIANKAAEMYGPQAVAEKLGVSTELVVRAWGVGIDDEFLEFVVKTAKGLFGEKADLTAEIEHDIELRSGRNKPEVDLDEGEANP